MPWDHSRHHTEEHVAFTMSIAYKVETYNINNNKKIA
jgi:hypothetical protein